MTDEWSIPTSAGIPPSFEERAIRAEKEAASLRKQLAAAKQERDSWREAYKGACHNVGAAEREWDKWKDTAFTVAEQRDEARQRLSAIREWASGYADLLESAYMHASTKEADAAVAQSEKMLDELFEMIDHWATKNTPHISAGITEGGLGEGASGRVASGGVSPHLTPSLLTESEPSGEGCSCPPFTDVEHVSTDPDCPVHGSGKARCPEEDS